MNLDHPQARAEPAADAGLPLEVRRSAVHGDGAFATRGLARGSRVGVYAGRRYAPGELVDASWDNALTYLFGLSDGTCIDGREGGNATRHINHSCAPNCAAVEVLAEDGTVDIVIHTLRRVRAGEELFIDYALDIGEQSPEAYLCRCGSRRCRGTMAREADDRPTGAESSAESSAGGGREAPQDLPPARPSHPPHSPA